MALRWTPNALKSLQVKFSVSLGVQVAGTAPPWPSRPNAVTAEDRFPGPARFNLDRRKLAPLRPHKCRLYRLPAEARQVCPRSQGLALIGAQRFPPLKIPNALNENVKAQALEGVHTQSF